MKLLLVGKRFLSKLRRVLRLWRLPLLPLSTALQSMNLKMIKVGFNRFQLHMNRLVNESNFLRYPILKARKGKKSHISLRNRNS